MQLDEGRCCLLVRRFLTWLLSRILRLSKLIGFQPLTAFAFTGLTVMTLATGCGEDNPLSDAAGALCCESFKVGADMSGADFGLEGDIQGQFRILAQASSDLSVVADGALLDVAVACENIARDMG